MELNGQMSDGHWSHRRSVGMVLLALTLAIVGVFGQARDFEFNNFDDDALVYENDLVRNGFSMENVAGAFTTIQDGAWMPLTWLSHMLDCQLFGMAAGFHHLTNVFWHILNTLAFFLVLKFLTGSVNRSAFVAGLFALHPLHVETVAWVADRKDLICTFFWLLAIWRYAVWVRRPVRRNYLLLMMGFAVSLMAKPMALTLPLVLLLLDFWPLKRIGLVDLPGRYEQFRVVIRLLREKIPLFLMSLASAGMATLAESKIGMVVSLDRFPLAIRLANAVTTYVIYLMKTIWPTKLVPFYLYPEHILVWQWGGAVVVLMMITFLAVYFRRDYPFLLTGWLLYLITLLPVIGLVQLGAMARADRFTYLPLTGVFIMVVWGVAELVRMFSLRRVWILTGGLLVLTVLAFVSWRQTGYWHNSRTLFEHTLAVDPGNYHAEVILGVYARNKGEYQEALAHLSRAIELAPSDHEAYATLGSVLDQMGRFQEAEQYYKMALLIEPTFVEVYESLGVMSVKTGDLASAGSYFTQSLVHDPDSPNAMVNLALVYYLESRLDEAERLFNRALEFEPRFAQAWNGLGLVRMKQGRIAEAISAYQSALAVSPEFSEAKKNLELTLSGQISQ